jgi:hypothetical protein
MSLDYRPMLLSHQLFRETVPLTAYTIGPISADQHKQIGIRERARYFQLRGCFMKQNYIF